MLTVLDLVIIFTVCGAVRQYGQKAHCRDRCTNRRPWYLTYYIPLYLSIFALWICDLERCLDMRSVLLPDIRESEYWRWLEEQREIGKRRHYEERVLTMLGDVAKMQAERPDLLQKMNDVAKDLHNRKEEEEENGTSRSAPGQESGSDMEGVDAAVGQEGARPRGRAAAANESAAPPAHVEVGVEHTDTRTRTLGVEAPPARPAAARCGLPGEHDPASTGDCVDEKTKKQQQRRRALIRKKSNIAAGDLVQEVAEFIHDRNQTSSVIPDDVEELSHSGAGGLASPTTRRTTDDAELSPVNAAGRRAGGGVERAAPVSASSPAATGFLQVQQGQSLGGATTPAATARRGPEGGNSSTPSHLEEGTPGTPQSRKVAVLDEAGAAGVDGKEHKRSDGSGEDARSPSAGDDATRPAQLAVVARGARAGGAASNAEDESVELETPTSTSSGTGTPAPDDNEDRSKESTSALPAAPAERPPTAPAAAPKRPSPAFEALHEEQERSENHLLDEVKHEHIYRIPGVLSILIDLSVVFVFITFIVTGMNLCRHHNRMGEIGDLFHGKEIGQTAAGADEEDSRSRSGSGSCRNGGTTDVEAAQLRLNTALNLAASDVRAAAKRSKTRAGGTKMTAASMLEDADADGENSASSGADDDEDNAHDASAPLVKEASSVALSFPEGLATKKAPHGHTDAEHSRRSSTASASDFTTLSQRMRQSKSSAGGDAEDIDSDGRKSEAVEEHDAHLALMPHDYSIQVILLPVVYSLLAFKSTLRMSELMSGTVHHDRINNTVAMLWNRLWAGIGLGAGGAAPADAGADSNSASAAAPDVLGDDESRYQPLHVRERKFSQYYEANFFMADLYVAWALWCFSRLCVGAVRNQGLRKNQHDRMFDPLRKITLLGVQTFVVVNAVGAAFQLALVLCRGLSSRYEVVNAVLERHEEFLESLESMIFGAGLIASMGALYNIVAFERHMSQFLRLFQPKWKFWSAKVLLSLGHFQLLFLNIAMRLGLLSEQQKKLLFATLVTLECLPIAVINLKAWDAKAHWAREPEWSRPSVVKH